MYRLVVTELAHQDLRNILAYLRNVLFAPEAATSFADEVQQCYALLKSNPLMYAKCNNEYLSDEGYRRALIKNYLLVFTVDEDEKTVTVYRLFHRAEDYPNKI